MCIRDSLKRIHSLKINDILLESGPTLLTSFISQDLIDEFIIYIAPKMLSNTALSFFDGELKYEHKNNKADKGEDLNTCLTCINNHYHNEKKVAGHIAKFLWFKFNDYRRRWFNRF